MVKLHLHIRRVGLFIWYSILSECHVKY